LKIIVNLFPIGDGFVIGRMKTENGFRRRHVLREDSQREEKNEELNAD